MLLPSSESEDIASVTISPLAVDNTPLGREIQQEIGTSTYTVWTEKGRRFIIALHENAWNVRKAVKQIKGEAEKCA